MGAWGLALLMAMSCLGGRWSPEATEVDSGEAGVPDETSGGDSPADTDTDTNTDSGPVVEPPAGFTELAAVLTLPVTNYASDAPNYSSNYEVIAHGGDRECADGSTSDGDGGWGWAYSLFDLTGDGWADLVVTSDTCTDPSIGVDHWDVYRGGPGGLAANPSRWSLPSYSVRGGFGYAVTSRFEDDAECADGDPSGSHVEFFYTLLDLSGDGQLDLVRTVDRCADVDVGSRYWLVHTGGASGFASDPYTFSLPQASVTEPAVYTWTSGGGTSTCAADRTDEDGRYEYFVEDVTGDGAPDLVWTIDRCSDPEVGVTYWRV